MRDHAHPQRLPRHVTVDYKLLMPFDRDRFVADCTASLSESDSQAAIHEHLARAVSDHASVLTAMGEPSEAGFDILVASPQLTIFAAKWAPNMTLSPHNHLMWALIGIYTGREDNIFWKRTANGLHAGGASALFAGDVASLPREVIHSVTNPLGRFTAGLHIYGGDFFETERSLWNAETLAEERSNGERVRAMFAAENAKLRR
jgi:predicted metal-dependent enzyme (double-stranded beta helix superfamily)